MLTREEKGEITVVSIRGRLDVSLSNSIENQLTEIIHESQVKSVLINLKDVEYMSSSGLRMLVAVTREAQKEEKSIDLCELNRAVIKLFEVVELNDLFSTYETQAEALDALNS
jgi:anti-anti-sigma factor